MSRRQPDWRRTSGLHLPRGASVGGLASAVILISTGCYRTTNVVTLDPLRTSYPVSASGQYVDNTGAIVAERDYTVLTPFRFERTAEAPPHQTRKTPLTLEPDLDRWVAQSHGDAVTNLKIEATDYDSGAHESASLFKGFGWMLGVGGALFVVGGATSHGEDRTSIMLGGGIAAGVGVLSYAVGSLLTSPTQWHLDVSGQVVRRRAPGPSAAP